MNGEPVLVVMPAYNTRQYVADAVRSVLAQTIPARLVVVDDASVDDTSQVVHRLAMDAPESVVVLRQQSNGGIARSRNRGIDYGVRRWPGTRYIGFLDSDDIWDRSYLEALTTILAGSDSRTLAAYCALEIINEASQVIGSSAAIQHRVLGKSSDELYRRLDFDGYLANAGTPDAVQMTLFRADVFSGPQGVRFDPRYQYTADVALIVEMLSRGGFMEGTSVPLLRYRHRTGQLTGNRAACWRDVVDILTTYVPRMGDPLRRADAFASAALWADHHAVNAVARHLRTVATLLRPNPEATIPRFFE